MNTENCRTVATNSLNCARMYCETKNFGRAFSHYLIALKLMPAWKSDLKETVSTVLYKWGKTLESEERYTDLFNCYEQAVEVFPENEYILNNLGGLLLKNGLIQEAAHYFRKSLDVRPSYLRALRNVENVANLVVQRWHFRMLNDIRRNISFREAIKGKVSQGFDTVLDIGTGTSILSLFALGAGAKRITACDSSSFMTEVAGQVIAENRAESIKLLNKHSSDLKIPGDLPERVKLVVTETVDCGLFGENILQTLIHAWDHLLEASGAVVPFGAKFYVVGAEFEAFRVRHYLTEIGRKNFNFEGCRIGCKAGDYDSENLKSVRKGFKYLTQIFESFVINFNDPESLKRIRAGERNEIITLSCLESGRLDCLVMWFDLYVDENREHVLSTNPRFDSCDSWDQAIFPLSDSFRVGKNEKISVKMSMTHGKLEFSINAPNRFINMLNTYEHMFNPSEELIKMLNSAIYTESFSEIIEMLENKGMTGLNILDSFPFPILGLRYLIKNRDSKSMLTCVIHCENDRIFLHFMAKKYDLDKQVRFISEDDLFDMEETGKFDVILLSLVDYRGEVRDQLVAHLEHTRSLLKVNGLFMPEKVTVVAQLVESEWLGRMTKVTSDHVTLGYRIGKFINTYQVHSHLDFDLNEIPRNALTEPFELCDVKPRDYNHRITVPVAQSGDVDALVFWFRIHFIRGCRVISTVNDGVTNQSALLLPRRHIDRAAELILTYENGLFRVELRR